MALQGHAWPSGSEDALAGKMLGNKFEEMRGLFVVLLAEHQRPAVPGFLFGYTTSKRAVFLSRMELGGTPLTTLGRDMRRPVTCEIDASHRAAHWLA